MKRLFAVFIPLLTLTVTSTLAEEVIIVRHYQHQERYLFGQRILDLALSKLDTAYQIEGPDEQYANEKRGEVQIIAGRLDLQWMSTTHDRERDMIPVKVPLYRGLLGLRLLLVTPKNQPALSQVRNLDDLRKFRAGHGLHWGDLPIYGANELTVHTSPRYDALFTQLIAGRFDYFSRGLNEIWAEQERHPDDLKITPDVMLFYPHPVYFFVGKHRPELATQIEIGLDTAINDGSYQELFMEQFGEFIRLGRLESRNLIILQNPVVPGEAPKIDTSWWLPQKFQKQINETLGY